MRKQISVTNEQVLKFFDEQPNVSKYIEKCVLWYEDFKEHDYITREEVLGLLSTYALPGTPAPAAPVLPDTHKAVTINKDDLKDVLSM